MQADKFIQVLERHFTDLEYSFQEEEQQFILTINGHKINFQKTTSEFLIKPNEWLQKKHINNKIHEPGLVATLFLLSKVIDQDIVFFDIGALFGYHSNIVASLNDNCKVVLVEGNPLTSLASKKIAQGQQYDFINSVVGEDDTSRYYFIDVYNFYPAISIQSISNLIQVTLKNTTKSVLRMFGFRYDYNSYGPFYKISTISVPKLLSKRTIEQIIMKIDAEGHQFKFLMPHIDYLYESGAILLIELDEPLKMQKLSGSNAELIDNLVERGFEIFWLDHRIPDGVFKIKELQSWMDKNSLIVCLPKTLLETL